MIAALALFLLWQAPIASSPATPKICIHGFHALPPLPNGIYYCAPDTNIAAPPDFTPVACDITHTCSDPIETHPFGNALYCDERHGCQFDYPSCDITTLAGDCRYLFAEDKSTFEMENEFLESRGYRWDTKADEWCYTLDGKPATPEIKHCAPLVPYYGHGIDESIDPLATAYDPKLVVPICTGTIEDNKVAACIPDHYYYLNESRQKACKPGERTLWDTYFGTTCHTYGAPERTKGAR